jgi:hypothetical protein
MPVHNSADTPARSLSRPIDACPQFGGHPRLAALRTDRCLSTIRWTPPPRRSPGRSMPVHDLASVHDWPRLLPVRRHRLRVRPRPTPHHRELAPPRRFANKSSLSSSSLASSSIDDARVRRRLVSQASLRGRRERPDTRRSTDGATSAGKSSARERHGSRPLPRPSSGISNCPPRPSNPLTSSGPPGRAGPVRHPYERRKTPTPPSQGTPPRSAEDEASALSDWANSQPAPPLLAPSCPGNASPADALIVVSASFARTPRFLVGPTPRLRHVPRGSRTTVPTRPRRRRPSSLIEHARRTIAARSPRRPVRATNRDPRPIPSPIDTSACPAGDDDHECTGAHAFK